ncbi:MAG: DUF72 domain-containing protein [Myxococcales bacterium]|nr:DUF72 domain-containing protein [Myxococcales bacterium]MDH3485544.1 DUF72 domain-containing protein [Myxococcales bacterium]
MKRTPPNPIIGRDEPQLGLFDEPDDRGSTPAVEMQRKLESIRARLPEGVRFGTSSWTFPGWAGLVYHRRYPNQRAFLRESLEEYAKHPLMRTVGVDRSYYTPVPEDDLALYAKQLPDGFRCAMKVWQRITMPVYPRHPRYGADAGKTNPHFLDADLFASEVNASVRDAFSRFMGPWILEVAPSPSPIDPSWFLTKLRAFFRAAPRDFPFAVELRDRRLLTTEYARALREHDAVHVFNYWSRMPSLADQMRVDGLVGGSLLVVRLLLPQGAKYAELKDAYAPFDKLVEAQPVMRQDVKRLVSAAVERDMEAYVLVNNKAEGSSPLTVQALAELLVR